MNLVDAIIVLLLIVDIAILCYLSIEKPRAPETIYIKQPIPIQEVKAVEVTQPTPTHASAPAEVIIFNSATKR